MDACNCKDFSRTRAAYAGNGLPSIEPGMPNPAGTGMDRRSFMLRSAGMALSVYGASGLGPGVFEAGVAQAAGGPASPVLVSVFLPGGLDALSFLAPVNDAVYHASRPNLLIAPNSAHTFADDTRLQWHPSAVGLKTLHEAGKVAVFPSIGYSHPDQSHFTSRHYWETGSLDLAANSGWLGRYLDQVGNLENPLQGLSLDGYLAPALATATVPVASMDNPTQYEFWANGIGDPVSDRMFDTFGALGQPATTDPALAQARRVARHTESVRQSIAPLANQTIVSQATYPTTTDTNDFPHRLAALAEMLDRGLPITCVSIEGVGGYDTHSDQMTALASNLQMTIDSLVAFQADLEARGVADRVLIQVWSEFGRRVSQNGNGADSGTDHGAAGVALLIGTQVQRQVVGEWSGINSLDPQGNMLHTSDFRVMYAAILDQWLGADPASIIPGADSMVLPNLIRAA